ncbi:MAG: HAD family hydrolase [Thermoplasmata archaeon]|nr:HAD family hydrolase [Thermoplasmata archaeon]
MPRPLKYDAVIFDLFGTIIDTFTVEDYDAMLHAMAGHIGLSYDDFKAAWSATFRGRIVGDFQSAEACIVAICASLGHSCPDGGIAGAAAVRNDLTRRMLVPRPDVVPTLARIRGMGCRLGLISDCSAEVPLLWEATEIAPLFDAAVFSCVERTRKPHPEIYNACCHRLGVKPDRCLYIGDGSSRELTGARQVGMTAVLIRPPHDDEDWYRPDRWEWDGPVVRSVSEVLRFLERVIS